MPGDACTVECQKYYFFFLACVLSLVLLIFKVWSNQNCEKTGALLHATNLRKFSNALTYATFVQYIRHGVKWFCKNKLHIICYWICNKSVCVSPYKIMQLSNGGFIRPSFHTNLWWEHHTKELKGHKFLSKPGLLKNMHPFSATILEENV